MKSENGTVYMIRGHDDEWVSPEPAEAVITEALLTATDFTDEDIDYIGSHVDAVKLVWSSATARTTPSPSTSRQRGRRDGRRRRDGGVTVIIYLHAATCRT